MSIRKFPIIAVTIALALAAPSSGRSANPSPPINTSALESFERLSDRDRQRLEEAGPAVVKMFAATLRRRFTAKTAGELRKFIDPRYLKQHRLDDGAFPIQTVVTKDIYDNQISDDPQTLLIVVETEKSRKEAFLFRTTVYENSVYILPLAAPDPATRSFTPWILRVKLD